MGPGIDVPGNELSRASGLNHETVLQWGPGLMSRETCSGVSIPGPGITLQWGPGLMSRETNWGASRQAGKEVLQWGPGLMSRET